jgi:LCP family protein required for cell wall assembly
LCGVALSGGGLALAQGEPVVEVHKVDEGHFSPKPDQPVFILALGIDGRAGIDSDRADAIHLIGVNAAAGSATILDIPRDTYVAIPGHGRSKINDAYTFGGPQLQAQTVEALTGVRVRFVVTTTFAGFPRMVDELGGFAVGVPYPMHDRFSGANFDPGIRHMNGAEAFAFARDRHDVPEGDVGRTFNQGSLIIAALSKLRGDGAAGSPAKTLKLLAVLGRHTRFTGAGITDLYNLGRLGLSIDPARVRNVAVPSTVGMAGSASVVFTAPGAGPLFADFRDDAVLQAH